MILCHQQRWVFFHNPKCAGSSFREALRGRHDDAVVFHGIRPAPYFRVALDHGHLRLWELQALYPRQFESALDYDSVIIVRDPRTRFLAALNEHFKKFQPALDLAGMAVDRRVAVIEEFISRVLRVGLIMANWQFVHFSPQLWFIRLADRTVPRHVVPMDDAGRFVGTVLEVLGLPELAVARVNPSPVDLSAALQSPVVQRCIEGFYAQDLEMFQSAG